MRSRIESKLKFIMYWFDVIMLSFGFSALMFQLAGKGLGCLAIILSMLFVVYLAGKSWFFAARILNE